MKKTKIALILMSCLLLTGCGNSADSAGSSAYKRHLAEQDDDRP